MGWDAFGLPAENAAIERGIMPHPWTKQNIAQMKETLVKLGYQFDWGKELCTCDEKYGFQPVERSVIHFQILQVDSVALFAALQ